MRQMGIMLPLPALPQKWRGRKGSKPLLPAWVSRPLQDDRAPSHTATALLSPARFRPPGLGTCFKTPVALAGEVLASGSRNEDRGVSKLYPPWRVTRKGKKGSGYFFADGAYLRTAASVTSSALSAWRKSSLTPFFC